MENLSIQGKSNFFEKRVSEYQKMDVMTANKEKEFRMDINF